MGEGGCALVQGMISLSPPDRSWARHVHHPRHSQVPLLFGQLLLGLINGAFYAMLSLGLAVIFGMLNIINFAHGARCS